MDLDARLEQPVLVSLHDDRLLQLLVVETGVSSGLCSVQLLLLLIGAGGLLGSVLADDFKDLSEFFLAELETQHQAIVDEVLSLDATIVVWIEGLVGFLDGDPHLLHLRPELAEQCLSIVDSLLELDAPSLREGADEPRISRLLNVGLKSASFLAGSHVCRRLMVDPVDRLVNCIPKTIELLGGDVEAQLLDTRLELQSRNSA